MCSSPTRSVSGNNACDSSKAWEPSPAGCDRPRPSGRRPRQNRAHHRRFGVASNPAHPFDAPRRRPFKMVNIIATIPVERTIDLFASHFDTNLSRAALRRRERGASSTAALIEWREKKEKKKKEKEKKKTRRDEIAVPIDCCSWTARNVLAWQGTATPPGRDLRRCRAQVVRSSPAAFILPT